MPRVVQDGLPQSTVLLPGTIPMFLVTSSNTEALRSISTIKVWSPDAFQPLRSLWAVVPCAVSTERRFP